MIEKGATLPECYFRTRVRDESVGGANPYRWEDLSTDDYFKGKRVVLFALPGAFTPTCSTYQLPGFEALYDQFINTGVDAVYCLSVNDAFVMNKWKADQKIEKIEFIPDGSGTFTEKVGALVEKDNLGFGYRSWRYAMVVDDGVVEKVFAEPGQINNHPEDPYFMSTPENVLDYCLANPKR